MISKTMLAAKAGLLISSVMLSAQDPPRTVGLIQMPAQIVEFSPAWVDVSITAGTHRAVVRGVPCIIAEAWTDEGWRNVGELSPPRRWLAPGGVGDSGNVRQWELPAGGNKVWRIDYHDWTIVGYAGRYRARAQWSDSGSGLCVSPWCEFAVEVSADGARLTEAKSSESEVWKAYRELMEAGINLGILGAPWTGSVATVGAELELGRRGVRKPVDILAASGQMPNGLRGRVALQECLGELASAAIRTDAQERSQMTMACQGHIETVRLRFPERDELQLLAIDIAIRQGRPEAGQMRIAAIGSERLLSVMRVHKGLRNRLLGLEEEEVGERLDGLRRR